MSTGTCDGVPIVGRRTHHVGMKPRIDPSPSVLRLAARQAGVVSNSQLLAAGLSSAAGRRWKRGWHRLGWGLYCLSEPTWESWCWAGVLRTAGDGVVGGRAAAHLHGLSPRPPSQITVWHERPNGLTGFGDGETRVRFRQSVRPGRGSLPRTGVEDSLLDAAGESDENEIIALTTRAMAESLTTPARLSTALAGRDRVAQRRILATLCGLAADGVESVLEWRFLQRVVRAHGLPEPERQVRIVAGSRTDCLWDTYGVVAELDGLSWHADVARDMHKDNRVALTGRLSLRYGWHDTDNLPCDAAGQLHHALGLGGFDGVLGRCPGCRTRPRPAAR